MRDNYCNQCGKCCQKIPVDFEKNIVYRDGIQVLTPEFRSLLIPQEKRDNITFCYCKYLKNNLCSIEVKPKECILFPSSPFAFLPDGCGFYGLIFLQKEKLMQQIRKMEEQIIHYEVLMQQCSKDEAKQYAKIIERHRAYINKYNMYF